MGAPRMHVRLNLVTLKIASWALRDQVEVRAKPGQIYFCYEFGATAGEGEVASPAPGETVSEVTKLRYHQDEIPE